MQFFLDSSHIRWLICKQSAYHSPQTMSNQNLIIQFFTGQMLFQMPNQWCQHTEEKLPDLIIQKHHMMSVKTQHVNSVDSNYSKH